MENKPISQEGIEAIAKSLVELESALTEREQFIKDLDELIKALERFQNVPYTDPIYKGRGKAVRAMKRYIANGIEERGWEVTSYPRKCLDDLKRWGLY